MLGTNAGIVEPGADRVTFGNLAVLVLQQIGLIAVKYAGETAEQASRQ